MKILIAGSDFNAQLLAGYMKIQSDKNEVYLSAENAPEGCIPVNIKENDVNALCSFVKYNQIELTAVSSALAVINGIADEFNKEGFPAAAPFSEAARITFFNSTAKKVMYKLKINTPRFGIFDRENIAADYIKRARFPIAVMNDFTLNERKYSVYKSRSKALAAIKRIFENSSDKVVIENYTEETPVYMYFLTDGYSAVHLISLERQEEENFIKIAAPSGGISRIMTDNILKRAVLPVLRDTAEYAGIYSGILGLKVIIRDNSFYVLEFYNGFQSFDLPVFLSLLKEDLAELFYASASKQLSGRSSTVLDDKYSYTLAVNKSSLLSEAADEDFFITEDDKNVIITKTASSMNYAKNGIEEYLETICRSEIFEDIRKKTQEELKV